MPNAQSSRRTSLRYSEGVFIMSKEVFKDVIGYEGFYQVSSNGRVKSVQRIIVRKNGALLPVKERILKQAIGKRGYELVVLQKNGNTRTKKIHQLVAESFLNHTPCGFKLVVDHIDNNPLNNNVSNLQIISHRDNVVKGTKRGRSNYVGVRLHNATGKWASEIMLNGVNKWIGCFNTELEASEAYNKTLKNYNDGIK